MMEIITAQEWAESWAWWLDDRPPVTPEELKQSRQWAEAEE